MTAHRDPDRVVRAWLELMPDEAPYRTVAAVLQAVEATPQARRPILRGPRRSTTMYRLSLIAAVAALGIALLVGALLGAGASRTDQAPDAPAPTPLPSQSTDPSPAAAGGPADPALRSSWIAEASSIAALGNGSGPVDLMIDEAGTRLSTTNFGLGMGFASSVSATGDDELRLVLDRAAGDCASGAVGTYRWSLSADRSLLTLVSIEDTCARRGLALARTWGRSLTGTTSVGAGFVRTMSPPFKIVLPDLALQARTLDDFVEIGAPDGFSLMVFKNPQPFVDACSTAQERVPWKPGAAAFIDAFRANDAFVVGEATPLTIDGHDALHVVIGGKANYERCPGQELYQYTPRECGCHFVVGQGQSDSMYLVDVGEDTLMFIISPISSVENEQPIIDSIRIPATIPSQ
jgi:hypothetical protein